MTSPTSRVGGDSSHMHQCLYFITPPPLLPHNTPSSSVNSACLLGNAIFSLSSVQAARRTLSPFPTSRRLTPAPADRWAAADIAARHAREKEAKERELDEKKRERKQKLEDEMRYGTVPLTPKHRAKAEARTPAGVRRETPARNTNPKATPKTMVWCCGP